MYKICTGCKVNKQFEEYGKDKNGRFGLNQKCIICCRIRNKNKKRSIESIEKNKAYKSEWQKKEHHGSNTKSTHRQVEKRICHRSIHNMERAKCDERQTHFCA